MPTDSLSVRSDLVSEATLDFAARLWLRTALAAWSLGAVGLGYLYVVCG